MTTTITIRENSPQAKRFIAHARSLPYAEVKRRRTNSLPTVEEPEPEFNLYESLDRAFAEVRLMLDGKQKEKTAQEFLEELRREKRNGK
jgi:hypothetical protein